MLDEKNGGLLYGLEQRIPPLPAFFSALQHVLAGLVGIITPPLIIGAALGLGEWLPYLISMSLLASGIGTFLQSNRVWGIGAGMICMQGTSFAFLGVAIAGGMWVKGRAARRRILWPCCLASTSSPRWCPVSSAALLNR